MQFLKFMQKIYVCNFKYTKLEKKNKEHLMPNRFKIKLACIE